MPTEITITWTVTWTHFETKPVPPAEGTVATEIFLRVYTANPNGRSDMFESVGRTRVVNIEENKGQVFGGANHWNLGMVQVPRTAMNRTVFVGMHIRYQFLVCQLVLTHLHFVVDSKRITKEAPCSNCQSQHERCPKSTIFRWSCSSMLVAGIAAVFYPGSGTSTKTKELNWHDRGGVSIPSPLVTFFHGGGFADWIWDPPTTMLGSDDPRDTFVVLEQFCP